MTSMLAILAAGLALLLAPATAQAQRVSPALEIGMRRSTAAITPLYDDEEIHPRNNWQGGVMLDIAFSPRRSLRIGARYSPRGFQETVDYFGTPLEVGLALKYLEIPALARLRLGRARGAGPYLVLGPVVSLEIGCEGWVSADGQTATATCADDQLTTGDDMEFHTSPLELAGLLGAGVELPAGPVTAWVEAGYQHGLTNIARESASQVRHRGLTVSLGIQLR